MLKNIIMLLFVSIILMQTSVASTIRFAQISDIHYAFTDKNDLMYIYRSKMLNNTINKINNDNMIQFTLVTGDTCIDTFLEAKDTFSMLNNLNNNWYYVLGNHEFREGNKEKYVNFLHKTNPVVFNNNKTFYSFKPQKDITFIGLDTVVKARGRMGSVSKEQMKFIEDTLQRTSNNDVVVIFSHHPLVRVNGISYMYNQVDLDKLFNKYDIPIIFLSGHLHIPVISSDKNIVSAVAPAHMFYPGIYRIITIGNSENVTVIDFDIDKADTNSINSWSKVMAYVYGGFKHLDINAKDYRQTIIIKKKKYNSFIKKIVYFFISKYHLYKYKINLKYLMIK